MSKDRVLSDEELSYKVNYILTTLYSDDPVIQLNQLNFRIIALINQQVVQALERAKSEAKDIGFGNGGMVSVWQLDNLIKEYKGE